MNNVNDIVAAMIDPLHAVPLAELWATADRLNITNDVAHELIRRLEAAESGAIPAPMFIQRPTWPGRRGMWR